MNGLILFQELAIAEVDVVLLCFPAAVVLDCFDNGGELLNDGSNPFDDLALIEALVENDLHMLLFPMFSII